MQKIIILSISIKIVAISVYDYIAYFCKKNFAMKHSSLLLLAATLFILSSCAKEIVLTSPDNNTVAVIDVNTGAYSLTYKDQLVVENACPTISFADSTRWGNQKARRYTTSQIRKLQHPLYGKNSEIKDEYNSLTLCYSGYQLVFRMYDGGLAYRFVGKGSEHDTLTVTEEYAPFHLLSDPSVFWGDTITFTSWELDNKYYEAVSKIPVGRYAQTPTPFVDNKNNLTHIVAEADLHDYPGMFLLKTDEGLNGYWAYSPSKVEYGSWGFVLVATERHDYLARVPGNHSFPWRILMTTDDDRTLLTNEMIWLLSEPCKVKDTDWIRPGKATWEWWHCHILENAPFDYRKLSTDLYKYYIDFASENKLEYLLVDAGWNDLFHPTRLNPRVDIHEVIRYGNEKNVGVWVWLGACAVIENPAWLDTIASWGVKGVKIDFFDRDDNIMQQAYEMLAERCADDHLLVDFHGCSKPTGLSRAYPNVLNYEAVRGEECCKWDTTSNPRYRTEFVFSRQLAGPMDYTPGSMRNCNRSTFVPRDPGLPSTLGTRSQELALYVVLDQPFAMLCDSPDEYRKDSAVLGYLSEVPVTWNKTIPLFGKLGRYAVVAKQTGDKWYVAGINNWDKRDVTLCFDFLTDGVIYTAECFFDTEQCADDATDYEHTYKNIDASQSLTITMQSGGGFVMVIRQSGSKS